MAVTSFLGKAFEKYFYDFSAYEQFGLNRFLSSKGQYVALRHVGFVMVGVNVLLAANFPFNPPFPTIGMCPAGWEGTWVCQADKAKALEMYKEWKKSN
uniref:ASA-9: Polytomella F-ATP synthase associated subunit 9 n=2 Tax=Polytomella TaxID=3049 RepID=A0A5H1ZR73_9CHLO|nr:Chain 9, Mitochondrial ATP synthase subunit ASA9 [Polytomella sp. Pringsheim 198.80]6RD5_9 Chain 9, Mitochondrial ATP synthase subunit ASA9 [Polytomella sp. Pringsheim 198.80]6RD7_9 Chain 9, ASA-9: Polytomella F-ATP synthase associated subunit 9 [Polytomella sp. Pringsheim 198.80]6RD8_9 Chain 9, ASA-9: Polytomella F-ATP synthase associated subunit 9 [Polytomella sp. Pringsheim 198.80]6RD9_9 Chain 9, ASA-9: Polytomella F-ATP synthase associated subunit 9 [Polytomella sp. Pringsheim 198.80]6R|eukprot:CAMPEP_0175055766 /NCGR_PEP_ID=MMETSP0052_2-20121109/10273_1 /TAXON_ID=51329 ORGANISM="Polytomella parva, Strain SAG 63-3" /NCGR_SAMPLE_ID=MMETSP0052_2 /ASSEMBLY_ACC=CAM_ASM_000194 /LENGTH=97 /DNA_ID=CAMNT_0016320669 /DNA_START=71 /DNA_END=364 /DNA_ORIENTATION=-